MYSKNPGNPYIYCDHMPVKTILIRTESGYRMQCLRCGQVSVEQDKPSQAFYALKGWQYQQGESA